MLRTVTTLAVAAAVGGGGTAAAVAAPQITAPNAPSITVAPQPHIAAPSVPSITVPSVTAPKPPKLHLRPVNCTSTSCSPDDPADLAGTIVSFNGSELTERTSSGHTYTALVDDETNVVCPTQQAINAGQLFNPLTPSTPTLGSGQMPGTPTISDKYTCSVTNLTAGRQIAGAELGHDSNGQLHWIAIALAPH